MKFLTFLSPGFQTKLYLPAEFCTKARADFSTEAVVVTSSGRWMIKAQNNGSGGFNFYGNGWAKFVNHHELEEDGVLEFEHHGSFLFHATIFDASACEKLEFHPHDSQPNIHDETVPRQRVPKPKPRQPSGRTFRHQQIFKLGANPTFTKVLSALSVCETMPSYSHLFIPTKIWRPNNLQEKTAAVLRIPGVELEEWPTKVVFYDPGHGCATQRLALAQGWHDFVSSNNIKEGDTCTFEIVMDASPDYSPKVVIIYVTKEYLV